MTNNEFSDAFSTLLNSYNTLAHFGEEASKREIVLDEYEKSVLLTLALDIVVKTYFDGTLNNQSQGFDDTTRRQVDFSSLVKVEELTPLGDNSTSFDNRGIIFQMPRKKVLKTNALREGESTPSTDLYEGIGDDINMTNSSLPYVLVKDTTDVLFILNEKLNVKTVISTDSAGYWHKDGYSDVIGDYTDSAVASLPKGSGEAAYYYILLVGAASMVDHYNDGELTFTKNGLPYEVPVGIYNITSSGDSAYLVGTGIDGQIKVEGLRLVVGVLEVRNSNRYYSIQSAESDGWSYVSALELKYNNYGLGKDYVIVPISYKEYDREMSKPYAQPLKKQAWRLFQNSAEGFDVNSELIPKWNIAAVNSTGEGEYTPTKGDMFLVYKIRYVKRPRPIILEDLPDDLVIDGENQYSTCELNPILHMDILNKAVELAILTRGSNLVPNGSANLQGLPTRQQQRD